VQDAAALYRRHRFPREIIAHRVRLYHRLTLSFRNIEEMLAMRGVVLTYANGLWRRRPRPGDVWHCDEVFLKINGETHYLWRAVDQKGNVLDILVRRHRNAKAAKKFFRKLLKGLRYVPRVVVTDKLRSYGAAPRELLPGVTHRQSKYLNNRAENSHQPTRERERAMKWFKSPGHAQRFLAAFSGIWPHFRPRRHRLRAAAYLPRRTVSVSSRASEIASSSGSDSPAVQALV
jgi:putative transposase